MLTVSLLLCSLLLAVAPSLSLSLSLTVNLLTVSLTRTLLAVAFLAITLHRIHTAQTVAVTVMLRSVRGGVEAVWDGA